MSYLGVYGLIRIFFLLLTKALNGDPLSIVLLVAGAAALVIAYKGLLIQQERRAEKLRIGINRGDTGRTPLPSKPLYTPIEPSTTNQGPTP